MGRVLFCRRSSGDQRDARNSDRTQDSRSGPRPPLSWFVIPRTDVNNLRPCSSIADVAAAEPSKGRRTHRLVFHRSNSAIARDTSVGSLGGTSSRRPRVNLVVPSTCSATHCATWGDLQALKKSRARQRAPQNLANGSPLGGRSAQRLGAQLVGIPERQP